MSFDAATARAMVAHLSPDVAREEWVRVGMALKAELGESGFEVFDEWSRGGAHYREADTRSTWRSIKAGGKTRGGTLVRMAQAAGWKRTDDKPRRVTAQERAAQAKERAEREARAAQEARELEDRHRAAAAEAVAIWEAATAEGSSGYLSRKGIKAHGLRFARLARRNIRVGDLLIPMRDEAGELVSLQAISEREKLFLSGARAAGAYFLIGSPEGAGWLLVVEGYATGASCHEATGRPVAVAFTAGNLARVVEALRRTLPSLRVAVAGDDDRETALRTGSNPGREAAEAAARAVGGVAVFPRFPDGAPAEAKDWNDLHVIAGLAAVREQVEAALQACEAEAGSQEVAHSMSPPDKPDDSSSKPGARGKRRERAARADEADPGNAPPEAFTCDDSGLWRHVPPGRDGEGGGWRRVCDPLHVEALARDQGDGAASLVLSFRSMFGQERRLILPLASLAGDGGAWRGLLADAGFAVPHHMDRRRWLGEYLAGSRPERHARLTERTGWHGRAFVLPGEVLGGDEGEPMLFVGEKPTEGGLSKRGDLERWRWLVGRHCVGQSRLMFAVAVALAGPCLAWASGLDGGGFHYVGGSSGGKTTTLRVGASTWGPPAFMQRWRATDNGLEGLASSHSDLCLILDELSQLDPKMAGDSAYLLANGSSKVRGGRMGGNRPRLTWRLLFLSSGEMSLADHMAEAGKKVRGGQELRLVDVPADAGKGFGVFDHRGEFEEAAALARHLNDATTKAYGALGRAWLEYLAEHTDTLSRELRERMGRFEARAVPESASGQVGRVARRFALAAAAGEMAGAAGLTGWEPGTAEAAALRMFNAWIEARPAGIGAAEDAAMLRQVRGWYESHGEARFTDESRAEDNHRPVTMHRAGWRRRVDLVQPDGQPGELLEWWTLPAVFASEVAKGWNPRAALRLLADRGHLHREKAGELSSRVYVAGVGRVQVYRIRSTLFDEAAD